MGLSPNLFVSTLAKLLKESSRHQFSYPKLGVIITFLEAV